MGEGRSAGGHSGHIARLHPTVRGARYSSGVEQALWFALGVIVMIAGLALSIALHEWGHYRPAKAFGVTITRFMVGFGPTLFSRQRGGTEFGVKAIPLGGYVSMKGMVPSEASGSMGDENDSRGSFYRLSVPRRIVVMLGGPVMNLVIAVVLYALLLMGFGTVQPGLTVGSVSECVVPATETRTTCLPTDLPAPGAEAGLLPGDVIVAVDGVQVEGWLDVTDIIRAHPGTPLALDVVREGNPVRLSITPVLTERFAIDDRGEVVLDDSGNPVIVSVGFVGFGAALETVRQPIGAVVPAVWDNITGVATILWTLPERMVQVAEAAFGPEERDPNGPVSVVGVGRIAGEIASIGDIDTTDRVAGFIALLASLNIALFVFNLIPLLPLDGGHVAVALIDGGRRAVARLRGLAEPAPFDASRLVPLTLVVVVLLAGMSVLLMYADIVNPISLIE